jgi:YVTN family beta-propeller protein
MKQLPILCAALALQSCAPAADTADTAPAAAGAGTLLIGNKGENTMSFVSLADGRELGRSATGEWPHEIAISPDGRIAAVVAYRGRTIDLFDIASRTKLRTIDLAPNEGPHGLVWLPDGRLVVTTERSRSVAVVDTSRGDAVSSIATGEQGTHMVAVSADGRRAYTANMQSASVSVIDLESRRAVATIRLGGTPEGIALEPDGRTLWISDNDGARAYAFDAEMLEREATLHAPVVDISYTVSDAAAGEIETSVSVPLERALRALPGAGEVASRIDGGTGSTTVRLAPGTPVPTEAEAMARVREASAGFPRGRTEVSLRFLSMTPLATVQTGAVPIRVVASPNGRWIVTSNLGDGSLSVIDARTRRMVRTIPVSGSREAAQVTILFSRDGRRIYAAETGRNMVAEVDFESGRVLRRLPAGTAGDGLAIAP